MIKEIVVWSNQNEGLISLFLSALTLLVSVLAIVISLISARLPYKKKVLVKTSNAIRVGSSVMLLYITVTNVGNRPVQLTEVGFLLKKLKWKYLSIKNITDAEKRLDVGEIVTLHYSVHDFQHRLREKEARLEDKVYAFALDSEGSMYKKKLSTVENIYRIPNKLS